MQKVKETYKKIDSTHDVKSLQVGMTIFKYPLRGNPLKNINLEENNHSTFEIKTIESTYIVLITPGYHANSAPLAKEFDRLISDGKWWYKSP